MIKRITSLLMAVALIITMSSLAFAAGKVEKIEEGVFVSSVSYTAGDKYDVGEKVTSMDKDFAVGETVNIFLDPSKFSGTDIDFKPANGMSVKDLEGAGVSVKVSGGSNSNIVQSVSFKEKEINGKPVALVQLKITDNLVATESKDFETKLTLYSSKVKQQELMISGSVGSSTVTVATGDPYIFLGNGEIAEAADNIAEIEIDAGNDISLIAKLTKGKKYYAVAHDKLTDADIEKLNNTEELDTIYYLDTDGFTSSNATVKIKAPTTLFVYGVDGNKLGTTDEKLALSSKYYLAKKEVNINSAEVDKTYESDGVEPEDEVYLTPVAGDDNEIPNTGISPTVKIAAAAMIVGIATIAVVVGTGKKKRK